MRAAPAFFLGVATAAALGAAAWALRFAPDRAEQEARVRAAEDDAARARREAADAAAWAEAERSRTALLEEQIQEQKTLLAARPRPAPRGGMERHTEDPEARTADGDPSLWDRSRLNQEIESLAMASGPLARHPRFPLVVRALRVRGDEGLSIPTQIIDAGLPENLRLVATALLEGLDDPRAVPKLLQRWQEETDERVRSATLRALARLPGEEQVPVLLSVWTHPQADPRQRLLAIQGLARRAHPVALEVVGTGGAGSTPALRVEAISALRDRAAQGGWKETGLVEVFGNALRTADGTPQRKNALVALEGFWTPEVIPWIETFLEDASVPPELASRARATAEAIRSGAQRPPNAGVPERAPRTEDDEE